MKKNSHTPKTRKSRQVVSETESEDGSGMSESEQLAVTEHQDVNLAEMLSTLNTNVNSISANLKSQNKKMKEQFNQQNEAIKEAFDKQNKNFALLKNTFTDITDSLTSRIDTLEQHDATCDLQIDNLDSRVQVIERELRSTTVKIQGYPEEESADRPLEDIVTNLMKTTLEIDFERTDIVECRRARDSNRVKAIMLKVRNKEIRMRILRNKNKLQDKMRDVFINEPLTREAGTIFSVARSLVAQNKITAAWHTDGLVFIRHVDQGPVTRISKYSQLLPYGAPSTPQFRNKAPPSVPAPSVPGATTVPGASAANPVPTPVLNVVLPGTSTVPQPQLPGTSTAPQPTPQARSEDLGDGRQRRPSFRSTAEITPTHF